MTENEFERLFEKVDPPDFIVPEAKAQLGRELKNASHFNKTSALWRPLQVKYIFGTFLALAATAMIMTINFAPDRISATELIRDIETAYDISGMSGKVHYVRFLFKVLDRKPIQHERWVYREGGKVRALQKDPETGEILGHSIFDGDRNYALKNSQLKMRFEIRKPEVRSGSGREVGERKAQRRSLNIIVKPAEDGKTTPDGQRLMQAFVMNDAFDYAAFERQSPREVIDNLVASSEVNYLGTEFDDRGQKLDVLERRTQAGSFSLKLEFPEKYFDQVCWICKGLEDEDISIISDSPIGEFLNQTDISSSMENKDVDVRQIIKVYADSRTIQQVTLSVKREGREQYRAEKTFLADDYLDYAPELFDPATHGLVAMQPKGTEMPLIKSRELERQK